MAAAYNREPELLRDKVRAIYFNAGNGPGGPQNEWNVKLDPTAYQHVFESGLPLYWCPCFGKDGYQTYFIADQTAVVVCLPPVQNYFVYCLTKSQESRWPFCVRGASVAQGSAKHVVYRPLYHAAGRRSTNGERMISSP